MLALIRSPRIDCSPPGQASEEGTFLVAGPPALVSAAGAAVALELGGRGGGRGDRFQGKCAKLSKRTIAAEAAEKAIASL